MLSQAAAPSPTWISLTAIIAIVVIALIVATIAIMQQQRHARLRSQFGPEYDRTVTHAGSLGKAEAELAAREKRVRKLNLVDLPVPVRDRYADEWSTVQARFVDDPRTATKDADRLVLRVMRDRGYPMESFDQRAADLSVDHPKDVAEYRAARTIALRNDRGDVTTEDLRKALVHYRALFESLLGTTASAARPPASV